MASIFYVLDCNGSFTCIQMNSNQSSFTLRLINRKIIYMKQIIPLHFKGSLLFYSIKDDLHGLIEN